MAKGRNPGIKIPGVGEASPGVRTALQQIVRELGLLSSPSFKSIGITGFTSAGFVKNDASGTLSGGNTIAVGDLPAHATEHESGGSDVVDHDSLTGFVSDEHVAHSGVTFSAGTGLTGGGDLSANRSFAVDGVLEDLNTLGAASSDGEFIVATGAGAFAYESGNTARTSLGLGTGDSPTFAGLTVGGRLNCRAVSDTTAVEQMRIGRTGSDIRYHSMYAQHSSGSSSWLEFRIHDGGGSPYTAQNTVLTLYGSTPLAYVSGDLRATGDVRADTAFNLNGTDIITDGSGIADIDGLAKTDGNFIVGDGSNWVAESGDTARTSLGLGTGDSPTFAGIDCNGGIDLDWTYTGTGASGFDCRFILDTSGGSIASGIGIEGDLRVTGSNGISNNVVGLSGVVRQMGTGTISLARGLIGAVQSLDTGTTTEGVALWAQAPYITAGTIGTAYGLYVDTQKQTGVTTGYGIYQSGASDLNYFDGKVGVGVSPSEDIHASDTVRADTAFNLNGTDGDSGTYNFYNDGTSGNVTQITVSGGIITSVTTAP